MFLPNNQCRLHRRSSRPDRRGDYSFAPPVTVPCAIVKLDLATVKTSVRADSSASRGHSEEEAGEARMLFPTFIRIREGDIVEANGEVLLVTGTFVRQNVLGDDDHIQVELTKGVLP